MTQDFHREPHHSSLPSSQHFQAVWNYELPLELPGPKLVGASREEFSFGADQGSNGGLQVGITGIQKEDTIDSVLPDTKEKATQAPRGL